MQQEQYIHIDEYGHKRYYKDRALTKLHRLDGPAIEWADGSKAWCVDGQRHRLDGPAFEDADGSKAWCVDGKYLSEKQFNALWCVDGKYLSEKQFNALTAPTVEFTMEDIAAKFGVDVSKLRIKK